MRKWSEEAWEAASEAYREILELPFLKELADGSLPMETFRFYISQDSMYINTYSRVLAHIASRLGDMADVDTFLRFAADGVAVEKALHESFKPDASSPMSMACKFYTSHLRAQGSEDVAVEAAAILPCFWVYLEVGKRILATAKLEGNPYEAWIRTYSDQAFERSNREAIEICDHLASHATPDIRRRMTDVFVDGTRLEWLFWHTAYNKQMLF